MKASYIYPAQSRLVYPFLVGLFGNLGLAVLKLGFALLAGTGLVLMDGLFSLMCVAAFLLPWQALILEKKTHDERYPYGLGKVLFLSMAVVGFLGLAMSVHMFYYSVFLMGQFRVAGSYAGAIMVSLISILANEALYRYLMEKSRNLSDAVVGLSARYNRVGVWISSFVLLLLVLGSLGATYLGNIGIAIISIIVFFVGMKVVLMGFGGIMDKAPPPKVLERIRSCARKVQDVKDVVSLKARHVGTLLHIDISISVDESITIKYADEIAQNVRRRLTEEIASAKDVNVIIA